MAKSKGNFFTLRSLLDKDLDPVVIRYLLISVPYRQKLNFTMDGLHAAAQAVDRIGNTLRRLDHSPPAEVGELEIETVEEFSRDYRDALADDLNTARALGALHILLRRINTALDGGGISQAVREAIAESLNLFDSVLDIFPTKENAVETDDEISGLVEERTAARAARDFARADELRNRLTELGIVVEDTPHGVVWHRKN